MCNENSFANNIKKIILSNIKAEKINYEIKGLDFQLSYININLCGLLRNKWIYK